MQIRQGPAQVLVQMWHGCTATCLARVATEGRLPRVAHPACMRVCTFVVLLLVASAQAGTGVCRMCMRTYVCCRTEDEYLGKHFPLGAAQCQLEHFRVEFTCRNEAPEHATLWLVAPRREYRATRGTGDRRLERNGDGCALGENEVGEWGVTVMPTVETGLELDQAVLALDSRTGAGHLHGRRLRRQGLHFDTVAAWLALTGTVCSVFARGPSPRLTRMKTWSFPGGKLSKNSMRCATNCAIESYATLRSFAAAGCAMVALTVNVARTWRASEFPGRKNLILHDMSGRDSSFKLFKGDTTKSGKCLKF